MLERDVRWVARIVRLLQTTPLVSQNNRHDIHDMEEAGLRLTQSPGLASTGLRNTSSLALLISTM